MLRVHLLKEVREQSRTLGIALLALPVLALGFGLLAPGNLVPTDIVEWFVLGALVLGLVLLGSDLVPGEGRRGQLDFLVRTPGALRASFVAKSIVLVGGLGTFALFGLLAGLLCDGLAGTRPDDVFPPVAMVPEAAWRSSTGLDDLPTSLVVWSLVLLVPWTLATSCWLKRSSSVLPMTLALLALLVVPHLLLVERYPVPLGEHLLPVGLGLAASTGMLSAWRSYVPGLRFGRSGRTLKLGLSTALLFAVPALAWSAERVHRWHHVDPREERVSLRPGVLAADGRTMLLRLQRHWENHGPSYVARIDLGTGEWSQLGSAWSSVNASGHLDLFGPIHGRYRPQAWATWTQGSGPRGRDDLEFHALDLCHDRVLPIDPANPRLAEVMADLVASAPERPLLRLPDGSRAWLEPGQVVLSTPDGRREDIAWPEGYRPVQLTGFGIRFAPLPSAHGTDVRDVQILDLSRRTFLSPEDALLFRYVRAGDWLLVTWGPTGNGDGQVCRVERVDPETGVRTALTLDGRERPLGMAGDGRLLLRDSSGRARLFEPETDRRELLPLVPDLRLADQDIPRRRDEQSLTTPDGREIWPLRLADRGDAFARRDGDVLTVTHVDTGGEDVELAAIPDDDHVLVIRGMRRLERWEFGSDRAEVLFSTGTD